MGPYLADKSFGRWFDSSRSESLCTFCLILITTRESIPPPGGRWYSIPSDSGLPHTARPNARMGKRIASATERTTRVTAIISRRASRERGKGGEI